MRRFRLRVLTAAISMRARPHSVRAGALGLERLLRQARTPAERASRARDRGWRSVRRIIRVVHVMRSQSEGHGASSVALRMMSGRCSDLGGAVEAGMRWKQFRFFFIGYLGEGARNARFTAVCRHHIVTGQLYSIWSLPVGGA